MNRKKLGKLGEEIAERHLKERGYKILDKNFSKRLASGRLLGEVDLIAKKDGVVSFVEVKTILRKTGFSPEQKVNFGKKQKIARAAEVWLQKRNINLDVQWSIDVISVVLDSGRAKVKHFKNV